MKYKQELFPNFEARSHCRRKKAQHNTVLPLYSFYPHFFSKIHPLQIPSSSSPLLSSPLPLQIQCNLSFENSTMSPSRFPLLLILLLASTISASRPSFLFTRTRGRCSPLFWSSRREAWPRMVPMTSTVANVFGSGTFERFRSGVTLLESTARNDDDDAFVALLKEAIAALLNSYSREEYPYSAWEVKTMLMQGLVSEKAAAKQARQFSVANEACN